MLPNTVHVLYSRKISSDLDGWTQSVSIPEWTVVEKLIAKLSSNISWQNLKDLFAFATNPLIAQTMADTEWNSDDEKPWRFKGVKWIDTFSTMAISGVGRTANTTTTQGPSFSPSWSAASATPIACPSPQRKDPDWSVGVGGVRAPSPLEESVPMETDRSVIESSGRGGIECEWTRRTWQNKISRLKMFVRPSHNVCVAKQGGRSCSTYCVPTRWRNHTLRL